MPRVRQQYSKILISTVLLASMCNAAGAAQRIQTTCQKRMSDNDIMVVDGSVLPESWEGFRLLKFTPKSVKDGWSYGPCEVTKRR